MRTPTLDEIQVAVLLESDPTLSRSERIIVSSILAAVRDRPVHAPAALPIVLLNELAVIALAVRQRSGVPGASSSKSAEFDG
jgi:hypothetical protein